MAMENVEEFDIKDVVLLGRSILDELKCIRKESKEMKEELKNVGEKLTYICGMGSNSQVKKGLNNNNQSLQEENKEIELVNDQSNTITNHNGGEVDGAADIEVFSGSDCVILEEEVEKCTNPDVDYKEITIMDHDDAKYSSDEDLIIKQIFNPEQDMERSSPPLEEDLPQQSSPQSKSVDKKCKFECEYCKKSFVTVSEKERHVVVHSGKKFHGCHICGQLFGRNTSLRRHMSTHMIIKPFKCEKCHDCFARKEYLSKHNKVCSGVYGVEHKRRYRKKVKKELGVVVLLNSELNQVTVDKEPDANFKESRKKKIQKKKSKRISVNRTLSSQQTSHPCEYCSRPFTNRGNLRQHLKVHMAEREFECHKCNVCEKEFADKRCLNAHQETQHKMSRKP